MTKKLRKPLSIILSLMMILSVFSIIPLTAYAAPTETLLTTITATGTEQASYSTANVATVSFSYSAEGSSAYYANWGWWGYGWTATVNAAEGYTITKCVFYDDKDRTATDSEAPFVVETTEDDKTPQVNGTPILAYTSKGIKKIEVYGYATPTTYTVTWKNYDGTELEKDTDVAKDAAPTYNGETPEKNVGDGYIYTFSGWTDGENTYGLNDELPEVAADVTYTAVFDAEQAESAFYVVGSFTEWQTDDAYVLTKNAEAEGEYMLTGVELCKDDMLKVVEVNGYIQGFEPVWYPGGEGNDYVVPADGIYDIYFRPNYDGGDDWYNNCIYVADVTPIPTYTVTWKNGDTVLETDTDVEEGDIPSYNGETPTKEEDDENTYEFSGWTDGTNTYGLNDALPSVTGDVSYTATFTATPKDPCAKGHTYGDPAWTVDANGNVTAKFDCSVCNFTTSVTITAQQLQALLAMGDQVTKTWNWAEDCSEASLTITDIPAQVLMAVQQEDLRAWIADCGITVPAAVTSETTEPKCDADGFTVYTATVVTETDTKTVTDEGSATGHSYEEPEWIANQNGSVTAKFDCTECDYTVPLTISAQQLQMLLAMGDQVTKTWNWADDYSEASLTITDIPAQVLMVVQQEDLRAYIAEKGITVPAVVNPEVKEDRIVYTAIIPVGQTQITDTRENVQGKLVNLSAISADTVVQKNAVTISFDAEGGTAPYNYTVRCKKSDATTWKYLAANTTTATIDYKPASLGTYDIQVLVKDASGRVVTKGFKLNVVEELKNDSTISATSVAAGSAVTLTAKATGGIAPYTYTLRCKKSDATTWKYLAANTDNETLTYKPNSEGTYDIQVLVKDASGKVVVKGFKLTVTEALKNNSAISATSVAVGTAVTLNANAEGGIAPYTYTYRCKKSDASSWKYLAANTDKTTLTYKPNSAGTYNIQVLVKDSSGKVVTRGFKLNVT